MERILKGKQETITYSEAADMAEQSMTEMLFFIHGMLEETVDDDDERADADVNFAKLVGKVRNAYFLAGLLCDPQVYIDQTFPEGSVVSIETAN